MSGESPGTTDMREMTPVLGDLRHRDFDFAQTRRRALILPIHPRRNPRDADALPLRDVGWRVSHVGNRLAGPARKRDRMKRRFMTVALLAGLVIGAVAAVAVAKTNTKDPTVGPKGLKFYSPRNLPKGRRSTSTARSIFKAWAT